MINQRTVLILGAGASSDYGFPLGRGLRNLICGIKEHAKSLIADAGFTEANIDEFVNDLRHSGYQSVDSYLEGNPEFKSVGKAAIAACLIPYEIPTSLFPPGAPNLHWYELLLNMMDNPIGEFVNNPLSVVTFNYDRSLEFYLFRALATRYRSEARAADAMAQFQLIHLHGSLGTLRQLDSNGREYDDKLSPSAISNASEKIIIVSEASGETVEFGQAQQLLRKAQRIVFLGFGYHADSIKRLRVFETEWTDEQRQRTKVIGTANEIPPLQWERIRAEVLKNNFDSRQQYGHTVYNFLNLVEPLDRVVL